MNRKIHETLSYIPGELSVVQFCVATLLLCVAALEITGCSFAPKYKTPSAPVADAYKETNGWKVAQPQDDTIRGKWWEMFGDQQLNGYEEQVTFSNQTVAAALASVLASRAIVREARSQLLPQVSANPSVERTHPSSSTTAGGVLLTNSSKGPVNIWSGTTEYSLPLNASWEPDLWGTIRNTVKADLYTAQASAATMQNLLLSAQADLAVDYFSLRGQDALVKVLDDTIKADQKTVDLAKLLFKTGVDSDEDVAAAETQLATVQAQSTSLGIQRAEYEHAIATLLGRSASTFSIPPAEFKSNPPAIPVGLPSQLLERRPDIAASERAVAAANAQIGVARAAFFPALTLSGSGGFESISVNNLLSPPSAVWSVGATAAQTVFDGGLRAATTSQYRAQYSNTVATYRQTVLTAFQQVEDQLSSLRLLAQERQQEDVAVNGAQRTLNLSTNRYELGIDSYLNVLSAQTTLLNTQQTAVSIEIQQMTASVQLIAALGGGWTNSLMYARTNYAAAKP
jgi:NodT family efflux transporter outer membrane factor (OMF) lipoprotein